MEVVIDAERFFTRIDRIQQHWQANKGEEWSNADAICIPMGAAKDNEVVYTKSSAMHLYLLGYEFSDSILVILKSKIYFMATEKKIAYFQNVIDINKIPLKVLTKTKVDIENRSKFREIINAIKSSGSTIGIPLKGEYPGSFIQAWNEELASAGLTTVDISRGLGVILAMKDETEQVSSIVVLYYSFYVVM
jgi:nucleosome binding factor SPN SPT16 subunit